MTEDFLKVKGRDPRIFGRAAIDGVAPLRRDRAKPRQLEQCESEALMRWCDLNERRLPGLELLYHIPNGGKRPANVDRKGRRYSAEANKLRKAGAKAGVPDYMLPVARGGYIGLFIELKAPGGSLSPEQKWWLQKLNDQGNKAVCCFGWEEAKRTLEEYLNGE